MDVSRNGESVRVITPAKLNLYLEVIGKRNDGFHEIETLMTAVTIYDTLYVAACPDHRIQLNCHWARGRQATIAAGRSAGEVSTQGDLPEESDNLVWKAVDRLRACARVDRGAVLWLVKRIPAAAGLGGASSDAAAALMAANHVWRLGWSLSQLAEVGAELGSDIPFFLGGNPSGAAMALCRGRGEEVEHLGGMPRLHFVIVRPPEGLATGDVYRACCPGSPPRQSSRLLSALRLGRHHEVGRCLLNRLQPAAEELSPWIRKTRQKFDQLSFLGHQMSGSGTSYFGICRHARHARRLSSVLRAAGFGQTFCAQSASTSHHLDGFPEFGGTSWRSPRFASN